MNSPDLAEPATPAALSAINPVQQGLALFQATPPDPARAAAWFRAAADAGDADGLALLGLCLLEGLGLPADPVQARSLLELAAARGSAIGQFQLGRALLTARGGPGDEARGLRAYVAAAALGHAEATFNLANCLFAGVGGLPDRLLAKALYLRSRSLGCPLRPQGVRVQRGELRAVRTLAQRLAAPDRLAYLVHERQQELALVQAIAHPGPRRGRGPSQARLRPWRLAAGVVAAMAGTLGQYLRPGSRDAGPTTINF